MTEPHTDTEYERAMTLARQVRVRDEHVGPAVAAILRAARLADAAPARGMRWRWLIPALGLAAAVGAAVALMAIAGSGGWRLAHTELTTGGVVQLGARVALAPGPGADYVVRSLRRDATRIELMTGSVTVRLLHGGEPHALAVTAGDLVATARGTIYTVSHTAGGPCVQVHVGTVEVRTPHDVHVVTAGSSWPPAREVSAGHEREAARLAGYVPLPAAGAAPDHDSASRPAGAGAAHAIPDGDTRVPAPDHTPAATPARHPAPAHGAATPRQPEAPRAPDAGAVVASLPEEWRRARLFRGQGRYSDALAVLDHIAASGDATWAPLALIEKMRLYADDLLLPAKVIDAGDAFLREYPAHALRPDVLSLHCAAYRQQSGRVPPACE